MKKIIIDKNGNSSHSASFNEKTGGYDITPIQTKRIFITGVEGDGSGSWDWVPNKDASDKLHIENVENFSDIEGEKIYQGELDVPFNLKQDEITEYVENYLSENGYEDSPLINKILIL